MKIEKAKRLLAGDLSVQETAEALGYSATSNMIRQFRQVTGIPPASIMTRCKKREPARKCDVKEGFILHIPS